MELERLPWELTICRVRDPGDVRAGADIFFLCRTDREISLVCRTEDAPARAAERNDGWRAFRVRGELDFSLTGILAEISGVLAVKEIAIFAVSTYGTDYVLVKEKDFGRAAAALEEAGHAVL